LGRNLPGCEEKQRRLNPDLFAIRGNRFGHRQAPKAPKASGFLRPNWPRDGRSGQQDRTIARCVHTCLGWEKPEECSIRRGVSAAPPRYSDHPVVSCLYFCPADRWMNKQTAVKVFFAEKTIGPRIIKIKRLIRAAPRPRRYKGFAGAICSSSLGPLVRPTLRPQC